MKSIGFVESGKDIPDYVVTFPLGQHQRRGYSSTQIIGDIEIARVRTTVNSDLRPVSGDAIGSSGTIAHLLSENCILKARVQIKKYNYVHFDSTFLVRHESSSPFAVTIVGVSEPLSRPNQSLFGD